jgi:hypothetical protein
MHSAEIEAWAVLAQPPTLREVITEGALARSEWSTRIQRPAELRDVAVWALGGWFDPRGAVSAAASVAVELAIIVTLWPEKVSDVLRPSWE